MEPETEKLLTPRQVARYLGVAESSLAVWRCNRRYDLPYIKIGGAVRYDPADVAAFVESRKVRG